MVVSMVLLTAFQVFWLRKEYREQESSLYKESDLLFKQTIRTMEDAMVRRKIDKAMHMEPPSAYPPMKRPGRGDRVMIMLDGPQTKGVIKKKGTFHYKDSSSNRTIVLVRNDSMARMKSKGLKRELNLHNVPADSVKNIVFKKRTDSTGGFTMVITMDGAPGSGTDTLDHVAKMMNPLRTAMIEERIGKPGKAGVPGNRMIYLNLTSDTLSLDSLQRNFRKQLDKTGKYLKIIVKRDSNGTERRPVPANVLVSNTDGPGYHYTARFPEPKAYLFLKIRPQILFSIILLAVTGLAFGFIYRSLQQQNRLNAIKNDLISNVTHELKTPLATVSVALEALRNFGGAANPELSREYLDISRNELNRLSLMVDNILKSSVLEQQSMELALEQLDFSELTEQVYQVWKPRFLNEKAEISLEITGKNLRIAADRTHMTNVLNNLIDNALKYGGTSPVVRLQLSENENEVKISISDNGIGIPKEYRSQVFEKFFRVPTGNRHNVKGYGLGLNYVKNIVKLHGGRVSLESTVGAGSRFTVTLKKEA